MDSRSKKPISSTGLGSQTGKLLPLTGTRQVREHEGTQHSDKARDSESLRPLATAAALRIDSVASSLPALPRTMNVVGTHSSGNGLPQPISESPTFPKTNDLRCPC